MSSFDEYRLLRTSELFDPVFYAGKYPDVAAANIDPLTHYIDYGAARHYQPSAGFDVAHYLGECAKLGETPPNPLLHFLKTGKAKGLSAAKSAGGISPVLKMRLERLQLTTEQLLVEGVAIAPARIIALEVLLDDKSLGTAQLQPQLGGYSFVYARPVEVAEAGPHRLRLRAHYEGGGTEEVVTAIETATNSGLPNGGKTCGVFVDTPRLVDNAAVTLIRGSLAINGWALAATGVERLDVFVDGREETRAQYGTRRDDVALQFPDWPEAGKSGFNAFIPYSKLAKGKHEIEIRLQGRSGEAAATAFTVEIDDFVDEPGPWQLRRRMTDGEKNFHLRHLERLGTEPVFVVVILDRDGNAHLLSRTLRSIRRQAYDRWDVVIASASAPDPSAASSAMTAFPAGRCRWLDLGQGASNPWSSGNATHVSVVEAGDELACDALLGFAKAIASDPDSDIVYGDDRRMNPATSRIEAFFKPDWSPDLLLAQDYIGRAWVASVPLLENGHVNLGMLLEYGIYDAVLRCTEQKCRIKHIPAVLVENHESAQTQEKPLAAVRRTLRRRSLNAEALPGRIAGTVQLRYRPDPADKVSIIIPTCGANRLVETCIGTIRKLTKHQNFEIICIENLPEESAWLRPWLAENTDALISIEEPFNWSRFNNLAVQKASGRFLLFLNDDAEIIEPDWLETLLAQAARSEIGAVGPMLLYPDQTIQHAGIFLAGKGQGRHAFRRAGKAEPGYFGLAQTQRDVIGVTGACLMTRRDVFDAEGGFDESQSIINNDLDYCLRLWRRGLLTVYEPYAVLIHHELASRGELDEAYDATVFDSRWSDIFERGDPYHSPWLSKDHDDFSVEPEPVETQIFAGPLIAAGRVRNILVVKLDHLGDCLTALPAIRSLKAGFPQAVVTMLSGPWADPVWAMESAIDRVLHFEYFAKRSAEGQKMAGPDQLAVLREMLEPYDFDIAIDLRKVPDARELLRWTGAAWLAGFDSAGQFPWLDVALEWEGDRALNAKHQHISEDLLRLAGALSNACSLPSTLVQLPTPENEGSPVLRDATAAGLFERPVAVIHPFVGNPMRLWPADHFARLIDRLAEDYWVNIAILGGKDDIAAAEALFALTQAGDAIYSFAGALEFDELPELLTRAALFIGNDSGPKHLAAGLGIPTIDIRAGVVDSREWAPFNADGVAIRRATSCSPCYIEKPANCPRDLACLTGLTTVDVLKLCDIFLRQPASSATEEQPIKALETAV